MNGDEHRGDRLRYGGKRMRIVSDLEFERAHRGLPEILPRARKTLVTHIHALELRLPSRLLDEPDQRPLDRRVARGRVAEEIFVHPTRLEASPPKYISH